MGRAILAAIEAPRDQVHNEAFNVGKTSDNLQVRDIAETVRAVTGCAVEYAEGGSCDARNYRVSFDKINARLPSFKATETLIGGVEELYRKFVDLKLTSNQFQSSAFTRLKRLRELMDDGRVDASLRWRNEDSTPMAGFNG